jgi:hypothetical protein
MSDKEHNNSVPALAFVWFYLRQLFVYRDAWSSESGTHMSVVYCISQWQLAGRRFLITSSQAKQQTSFSFSSAS